MFAAFRIIYSEADCEYPLDSFIEKRKIMGVLNIVLHEPEIPANTGNIGRTCVATGTRLHLIEPLGFRLNEKAIKRAGMDYWEHLDVTRYLDYEDFLKKNPGAKIYYATTKAPQTYTDVSNSVAIVLYEALRQHNFAHMNLEGHLRNYDWK